jgi:hypothetical protein
MSEGAGVIGPYKGLDFLRHVERPRHMIIDNEK